jgi:hypothetical protein
MPGGNQVPLAPEELRKLISSALPERADASGPIEPASVYLPASHLKALRPDAVLISGMRGAGKSFWWTVLQDQTVRRLLHKVDPKVEIEERTEVAVGFGERPNSEAYPDRDMLASLLNSGLPPRMIWRSVVVRHHVPDGHELKVAPTWEQRVRWVQAHPEETAKLLEQRDRELEQRATWHITLFDALDRSASDWQTMDSLIRGLLQVALDCRSYRRLRVKCFLREDQLDENRVGSFADASKVLGSRIELSWDREDLYGMLWQYMANAPSGEAERFRRMAEGIFRKPFEEVTATGDSFGGFYRVPPVEAELHKELFEKIAGQWMGRGPKRGRTYTWIPNHLADARQRTSPRSFLVALRTAAEDSDRRYPRHERALHYESIKAGVREASKVRVLELGEDYPWVEVFMKALSGLTVPCDFRQVKKRWEQTSAFAEARKLCGQAKSPLPPSRLDEGPEGVRKDLEDLGVFQRLSDGRVNIPDVFRIGYGLGRRGGVRP